VPPITPELDQRLLIYLFWAYTAALALLFAYVGRLMRKVGELERELGRQRAAGRGPGPRPPGVGS